MRRKPRLTDLVMSGLTEAMTRMEADDITDLEEDRDKAFQAARKWIEEMYAYRREHAAAKITAIHQEQGRYRDA